MQHYSELLQRVSGLITDLQSRWEIEEDGDQYLLVSFRTDSSLIARLGISQALLDGADSFTSSEKSRNLDGFNEYEFCFWLDSPPPDGEAELSLSIWRIEIDGEVHENMQERIRLTVDVPPVESDQ